MPEIGADGEPVIPHRGTGGISKSQIPPVHMRPQLNPWQQQLTSQQIYQQNYYYIRKFKKEIQSLEKELAADPESLAC